MTNDINAKIPRYRSADTGARDLSSYMHAWCKIPRSPGKEERNSIDRQIDKCAHRQTQKTECGRTDEMSICTLHRREDSALGKPMQIWITNTIGSKGPKQMLEKLFLT